MKRILTRREFLGGLSAGSGLLLSGCSGTNLPPNFNGVFGISDYLTMKAQRLLMSEQTAGAGIPPSRYFAHVPNQWHRDAGK